MRKGDKCERKRVAEKRTKIKKVKRLVADKGGGRIIFGKRWVGRG
jgi:hypothetical protein